MSTNGCGVEGCERTPDGGHKLCSMHRSRLKRSGSVGEVEARVEPKEPVPSCASKEELKGTPKPEARPCKTDGCTNKEYIDITKIQATNRWVWGRRGFCIKCRNAKNPVSGRHKKEGRVYRNYGIWVPELFILKSGCAQTPDGDPIGYVKDTVRTKVGIGCKPEYLWQAKGGFSDERFMQAVLSKWAKTPRPFISSRPTVLSEWFDFSWLKNVTEDPKGQVTQLLITIADFSRAIEREPWVYFPTLFTENGFKHQLPYYRGSDGS
jgi:hypothetical protein